MRAMCKRCENLLSSWKAQNWPKWNVKLLHSSSSSSNASSNQRSPRMIFVVVSFVREQKPSCSALFDFGGKFDLPVLGFPLFLNHCRQYFNNRLPPCSQSACPCLLSHKTFVVVLTPFSHRFVTAARLVIAWVEREQQQSSVIIIFFFGLVERAGSRRHCGVLLNRVLFFKK